MKELSKHLLRPLGLRGTRFNLSSSVEPHTYLRFGSFDDSNSLSVSSLRHPWCIVHALHNGDWVASAVLLYFLQQKVRESSISTSRRT